MENNHKKELNKLNREFWKKVGGVKNAILKLGLYSADLGYIVTIEFNKKYKYFEYSGYNKIYDIDEFYNQVCILREFIKEHRDKSSLLM